MAVGLLAGLAAFGIAAGLAEIGNSIEVHNYPIDPSGVILLSPVVVVPWFAGRVLRRGDAIAAVAVGAVAGPIAAMVVIDGSCLQNMWAAALLFVIAGISLVVAGTAARFGASQTAESTERYEPASAVAVLLVVAVVGVVALLASLAAFPACP